MRTYIGTSGYSYKQWKGRFYPEKTASGEMLRSYSERLNSVEINNTFYHMPTEKVLSSWAAQVPDNFRFAIKAPQLITHLKQLKNVEDEIGYFFRTLQVLGHKLGSVLFQFPASFRADIHTLEDFLKLLPDEQCAFEFRHQSWLDADILDLLHKRTYGLCIADTDENPAKEIIKTSPWGYLRLRRSVYTDDDLSNWLERISSMKWEQAFIFFKHEEEAAGPEMAMRLRQLAGPDARKLKKYTRPIG